LGAELGASPSGAPIVERFGAMTRVRIEADTYGRLRLRGADGALIDPPRGVDMRLLLGHVVGAVYCNDGSIVLDVEPSVATFASGELGRPSGGCEPVEPPGRGRRSEEPDRAVPQAAAARRFSVIGPTGGG
jgi:hypothetical protein